MRAVRQFLRTHRVPLIAVALAALHSLLFWSLGPRVPLGLFIAAVMVSAWHGGIRPAVLATALSALLLAVIAHYQTPGPEEDLVLRLGLFVLVGLIAGYLSQQCRQAIRAVEHVHDIIGGSGIALISADAEGRVTSLNPLARTLTGLGEADAGGRPLGQVFHLVHGPGRQPVPLPAAGTAQELPEGALLLGANGAETAVDGSVGPVRDGDGRPAGVMVVFREAGGRTEAWQELRQRADRFRALAGYAPAGLMVLDAEGRCVFSNPAAQAACGCSADESLGEGWSRHVQPQDRDRLIGDWLRAVVSKQPFADEFRVATGPGAGRWLRLRSAPMLADGGEVLGHVAALEEVTERRQAEGALADAWRESEEHLQEWAASEKEAEAARQAARAEAEQRLREVAAARAAAEEATRKVQGQFDERGTALRRAEEALRAARAEAEQQLREAVSRRQEAEEVLTRARAEFQTANAEALAGRCHAEEELGRLSEEVRRLSTRPSPAEDETRAVRDAWREEVEAVVAMHLDAHERLRSVHAEKDATAESLRNDLARLAGEAGATRESRDRLQALLDERDGNEESLRRELQRFQGEAAALRQAEEVSERLRAQLAERDQREESLRREKAFLEGVIDGSPAGIFAHDRDGRCRVWNAALERFLGRPRSDALGRTAAELFPPVADHAPGADEERLVPENGAVRAGLPSGGVLGRSEVFESMHAPVRDPAGEVVGGMTMVRVLPQRAPQDEAKSFAAGENGAGSHGPAACPGAIDWLAFN